VSHVITSANRWADSEPEGQSLMMNIISLGAGVQSSTMALMAAHGEITPMPDCAIFADTQSEPGEVYRHLDWLEKQLPFPVHRVAKGNLMSDQVKWSESKDGTKYLRNIIPAFTKAPDGTVGMLLRKCTGDYKLAPIRRKVRELSNGNHVIQWIGISLDEALPLALFLHIGTMIAVIVYFRRDILFLFGIKIQKKQILLRCPCTISPPDTRFFLPGSAWIEQLYAGNKLLVSAPLRQDKGP